MISFLCLLQSLFFLYIRLNNLDLNTYKEDVHSQSIRPDIFLFFKLMNKMTIINFFLIEPFNYKMIKVAPHFFYLPSSFY